MYIYREIERESIREKKEEKEMRITVFYVLCSLLTCAFFPSPSLMSIINRESWYRRCIAGKESVPK